MNVQEVSLLGSKAKRELVLCQPGPGHGRAVQGWVGAVDPVPAGDQGWELSRGAELCSPVLVQGYFS